MTIISNKEREQFDENHTIEIENLSLVDKEIELIKKALEKSGGKRKHAAKELEFLSVPYTGRSNNTTWNEDSDSFSCANSHKARVKEVIVLQGSNIGDAKSLYVGFFENNAQIVNPEASSS